MSKRMNLDFGGITGAPMTMRLLVSVATNTDARQQSHGPFWTLSMRRRRRKDGVRLSYYCAAITREPRERCVSIKYTGSKTHTQMSLRCVSTNISFEWPWWCKKDRAVKSTLIRSRFSCKTVTVFLSVLQLARGVRRPWRQRNDYENVGATAKAWSSQ